MHILLKFVVKNIIEKKLRLFLIILSVTLSSALFFASNAMPKNIEQIYLVQMRQFVGKADLYIHAGKDNKSSYFYMKDFEKYRDKTAFMIGALLAGGTYQPTIDEEVNLMLYGCEYDDLMTFNPVNFVERQEDETFNGKKIIISLKTAEKHGLKVNDMMTITASNGNRYQMIIYGVVEDKGLFQNDNNNIPIVMPRKALSKLLDQPNKVSYVFVKAKDDYKVLLDEIKSNTKNVEVKEAISIEELRNSIAQITTIFKIMLVLVIFISVYIIFTAFKVIMAERLPMIGTFRSIGATKNKTNLIMLLESLLYGSIGGVLGIFMGIGVLKLIANMMAYNPYSGIRTEYKMVFGPIHIILTISLAIGLSIISSIIPIIKSSKVSIKDIVLNQVDKFKYKKRTALYIGSTIFILSLMGLYIPAIKGLMIGNIVCMVGGIIGLVMIIPIVVKGCIKTVEKPFEYLFGYEGVFALKNISDNKNIMNNIILMTIGIASLFMVNTIAQSVTEEVVNVYNEGNFEIWSWIGNIDEHNINLVKTVDGVEDVFGAYKKRNIKLYNTEQSFSVLYGIDPNKYFDYWEFDIIGDKEALLRELSKDRNIIMNKFIMEKFDLEVGNTVTLSLNDKPRNYKLIGMMNTLMQNGQIAVISDKYYKQDLKPTGYGDIYIRAKENPDEVLENLKKRFSKTGFWGETMVKMAKSNEEANNQIFIIMQAFSVLTMVIGAFGIFNNYVVNMLSRKRYLAVYRSVGMSKKQMRKMLFIESFASGFIGGVIGLAAGVLFVIMAEVMMVSMELPVAMNFHPLLMVQSVLGGIAVSLIASISPVLKSSKLGIIQAIKYE